MKCKENEKYTKQYLGENIVVLKDNEVYRMNDVIKAKLRHKIIKKLQQNKKYENTLLKTYLDKYVETDFCKKYDSKNNTPNTNNFKHNILYGCLLDYIKDDTNDITSYDNTHLHVHLRLGDLIHKFKIEKRALLIKIQQYISKHSDISKIVIVTAFHYGQPVKKTINNIYNPGKYSYDNKKHAQNLNLLHEFISVLNYPVIIQSSQDVDRDFCMLSTARHLIISYFGFSKLVKIMNDKYSKEPRNE